MRLAIADWVSEQTNQAAGLALASSTRGEAPLNLEQAEFIGKISPEIGIVHCPLAHQREEAYDEGV